MELFEDGRHPGGLHVGHTKWRNFVMNVPNLDQNPLIEYARSHDTRRGSRPIGSVGIEPFDVKKPPSKDPTFCFCR